MLTRYIVSMMVSLRGRRGQGMTEYAVVVALVVAIAVAVLGTGGTLDDAISGLFGRISTAVNGVTPAAP